MTDQRVGAVFRAVRQRKGWRQEDVAAAGGVSRTTVSLIERGHLDEVSLPALRRVAKALDIKLDYSCQWRGGELDRLLNAGHSALENAVAGQLSSVPGWTLAPEASFSIYGERGWIDLLAWHAPSRSLVVIEIKTEIVDVQELIGLVDRKSRLAPQIARERGWQPLNVASWLVVAESSTNRRRVAAHRSLLRAAFPDDARVIWSWLRQPVGRLAVLSFLSYSGHSNVSHGFASRKRIRREATGSSVRETARRLVG